MYVVWYHAVTVSGNIDHFYGFETRANIFQLSYTFLISSLHFIFMGTVKKNNNNSRLFS